MSVEIPGETQAELVERRGAASRARWVEQDAAIAAHKAARAAAGIPEPEPIWHGTWVCYYSRGIIG